MIIRGGYRLVLRMAFNSYRRVHVLEENTWESVFGFLYHYASHGEMYNFFSVFSSTSHQTLNLKYDMGSCCCGSLSPSTSSSLQLHLLETLNALLEQLLLCQ
jgi:hypothetical protein